mgnify:CR=1 FL=1
MLPLGFVVGGAVPLGFVVGGAVPLGFVVSGESKGLSEGLLLLVQNSESTVALEQMVEMIQSLT